MRLTRALSGHSPCSPEPMKVSLYIIGILALIVADIAFNDGSVLLNLTMTASR